MQVFAWSNRELAIIPRVEFLSGKPQPQVPGGSMVTVWDWTVWCGPRLAKGRVWRCALSQVENTNGTAGDTQISIEQKASDQQTGFCTIGMRLE